MTGQAADPDQEEDQAGERPPGRIGPRGGDFAARDKVIGGDEVGGDKIAGSKVAIGSIAASQEVSVAGRDVRRVEAGTYIEHATFVTGAGTAAEESGEAPAPGESPYKGLRYFDVADAALFFGRETLTARLAGRLRQANFLAVVGASGSGKSSLVRAGLLPALQRGDPLADGSLPPPGSAGWQVRLITPTAHPLRELAACLTQDIESVSAATTLMDDFARDARSLDIAASRLLKRLGGERLLLAVDQFEELFTACKDPAERKYFIDNLLCAAAPETVGATVLVITLRADFYHHCAQYENLRQVLAQHQEYIGAMSAAELRQAIQKPAELGGWVLEDGLVELRCTTWAMSRGLCPCSPTPCWRPGSAAAGIP